MPLNMRCLLLLAMGTLPSNFAKPLTPRLKWGQDKQSVFLSVIVRDLAKDSVSLTIESDDTLTFNAKNKKGESVKLDLPFREDVKTDTMKWEHHERSDKWGEVVFVHFKKHNEHRWDVLSTGKKVKGLTIDKDWTREDQTLEPEEEIPYLDDNSGHLLDVTAKNIAKTKQKFGTLILNTRYPWCSQCKSQDDIFAKAAKAAKAKSKKDKTWKAVAFGVVDAREERMLARKFGAKCEYECRYQVFTGPDEEHITIKSKFSEEEFMKEIEKYRSPAVMLLKSGEELETLKKAGSVIYGAFDSEKNAKYGVYKKVANVMRGSVVFAALIGKESPVELWPANQSFAFKYDGDLSNSEKFQEWVSPRAIPLFQPYDWQLRDTYEKLQLPLAKVWLDEKDGDPAFLKVVRHATRRLAKKYIGRLAFVEMKKTMYSYELKDFGLNQPEEYPAIGIASNATYTAVKYGYDPRDAGAATSAQEFWKDADKAVEALTIFCDKFLEGSWPEAHESAAPQTNWTRGTPKTLVWKRWSEIEKPSAPILLEVYGKYRAKHDIKAKESEHLATALEPYGDAFTLAKYDTSDNYFLPSVFKRDKYASDTEWFWVAPGAEIKKLLKPKKDAPIKKVVEFAKKHSTSDVDVDAVMKKFDERMTEDPPPAPREPEGGMGGMGAGMPDMSGMGGAGGAPGIGGMGDMPGMGGMGDMGGMADMMKGMAGAGGEL